MSKAKNIENINNPVQSTTVKILFRCPVCAKSAHLNFGRKIFESSEHLTTISVSKDVICDHGFHAFVDKNYQVRGYQRIDFEVHKDKIKKNTKNNLGINETHKKNERKIEKKIDFKQFNLNKNELTYYPKSLKNTNPESKSSLKNIYEDFWEYIPNDNKKFKEYINKDKRRIHFIS